MSVIGDKAFIKKLEKLSSGPAIEKALGQAGAIVEAKAMKEVTVDTGHLRNSIGTKVFLEEREARVGTNVEYAPYVEYGTGIFAEAGNGRQTPWSYQNSKGEWITTSGQRAKPFLGPALRSSRAEVMRKFKEVLKEEMGK